jgi:low temperature requirement protein LtrA
MLRRGTRRAWQTPELRDDDPGRHHTVGWVELFFDLVFVVVIAVLADNLVTHEDLPRFALQFTAVFWVARRPTSRLIRVVLAWIYLHLLMLIGIVVIGVGLSDALAASTEAVLPTGARNFLLFGTAEVLAAVACIELTVEREPGIPTSPVLSPGMKLLTATAVAGIALSPLQMNAFVTFGILIAALAALAALAAQAAYAARVYYR